ncbi:hypothetical protein SAMN04489737_0952 [Arcanobacterium phocae]|uniref:Uncharacterized protein n=2 Tax=Arcanobacterium phocae TaxID=131112 RepID=A0A1H2LG88_9ACTO|nr:hypothetical protein SAMN04489737_0952 [Arcanobacterium phocae]
MGGLHIIDFLWIITGCALAYAVITFPKMTDRMETRRSSFTPRGAIPLPAPTSEFIARINRREKRIRPQLKIAMIFVSIVQLAFLGLTNVFSPLSFMLSLIAGYTIVLWLRFHADMADFTGRPYPDTDATVLRHLSCNVQPRLLDYVPVWALIGYITFSLISQTVGLIYVWPALAAKTLFIILLAVTNMAIPAGIYLAARYASIPISARDDATARWEDDFRAEMLNAVVMASTFVPLLVIIMPSQTMAWQTPGWFFGTLLACIVGCGIIIYWASRSYARVLWKIEPNS